MSAAPRFPAARLHALAAGVLGACGLPAADAEVAAGCMIEADLTGADAHGIFRLPQYADAFARGDINPRAAITVAARGPATALVDGDNGMGHLAVTRATALAVELARASGVAWVGTRNTNHAGAGGVYVAQIAAAGMVGLFAAVSGFNQMAPWGGAEALLGTNPLAIAIPAGAHPPVIVDTATAVASAGAIKAHALRGEPLPAGWMIDPASGEAVTDATRMMQSLLAPIGGHKGSGLALALGLLAGPLNGAAFGRDIPRTGSGFGVNSGHFVLALDVARFGDAQAFAATVDRHAADLAASTPLPGAGPVRVPGAARAQRRSQRLAEGIALAAPLVAQLDALAVRHGLAPLA